MIRQETGVWGRTESDIFRINVRSEAKAEFMPWHFPFPKVFPKGWLWRRHWMVTAISQRDATD